MLPSQDPQAQSKGEAQSSNQELCLGNLGVQAAGNLCIQASRPVLEAPHSSVLTLRS